MYVIKKAAQLLNYSIFKDSQNTSYNILQYYLIILKHFSCFFSHSIEFDFGYPYQSPTLPGHNQNL